VLPGRPLNPREQESINFFLTNVVKPYVKNNISVPKPL
jgi:hypothetical protein